MHGSFNDLSERLYLQKDSSGDISVPCSDLKQHQIDGVRFLFSQYKKDKPGVILNYPPSCGNSVLVAVYISAVFEKLKRPALILYEDVKEKERWLERFRQCTSVKLDSIEVDTLNPYLRKPIFISNIGNIVKLNRRIWSIVVVKSNRFYPSFQKCELKVDFKIWITSQDLKKDKQLLRSVVTWIYPKDPFLQQYLDNNEPALLRDEIPNDMLLDLLLEDILYTRKNIKPIYIGPQKRKQDTEVQTPPFVSKKNKDATGTKIKRSKKPPEPSTCEIQIENVFTLKPNNDNPLESLNVISKSSNGGNVSVISTRTSINEEEPKMDVESFIRDNDPVVPDNILNSSTTNLNVKLRSRRASSPTVEEESVESVVDFACAVEDIVRNENDIRISKCADNLNEDELLKDDDPDLTPDLIQEEDIDVKTQIESEEIDVSKTEIQKISLVSYDEVINKTESKKNIVSETEAQITTSVSDENVKVLAESKKNAGFKSEINKTLCLSDEERIDQTESKEINVSEIATQETPSVSDEEAKNQAESKEIDNSKTEIQNTSDKEIKDRTISKDIKVSTTEFQIKPDVNASEKQLVTKNDKGSLETGEVKTEKESSDGEGDAKEVQESKLEVSTSVKKETDSTFDVKMKEFEAKALRKFKGSVLDNILF